MKTKQSINRNILLIIILFAVIILDQATKIVVRQTIDYRQKITVIDHFITMTKVENTGAFLSLGDSLSKPLFILLMVVLPLGVIGYALYYLISTKDLSSLIFSGIALIIAGGLGNIIDRIIFGSVTDFLHFNFGLFQTGIVNVADMAVTTGFFFIVFSSMFKKKTA